MAFLKFNEAGLSPSGKTKIVHVLAAGGFPLGNIQWYAPWRKYCFFPSGNTVFDAGCMREIAQQLVTRTDEHRNATNTPTVVQDKTVA